MPEAPNYQPYWDFLEEGGFDMPAPIASRAYPYERDEAGAIVRDSTGRPRGGKVYHISSPDAETGIRLTALADIAKAAQQGAQVKDSDLAKLKMDDEQEVEFAQQVLGATYDELRADGVEWTIIQRVTQYAYIYFTMGANIAESAARDGLLSGKALALPNRATRRATTTPRTPSPASAGSSRARKSSQPKG